MREEVESTALSHEDLDLIDLGDAAVETKQVSPQPVFQDSIVGWGEWG